MVICREGRCAAMCGRSSVVDWRVVKFRLLGLEVQSALALVPCVIRWDVDKLLGGISLGVSS